MSRGGTRSSKNANPILKGAEGVDYNALELTYFCLVALGSAVLHSVGGFAGALMLACHEKFRPFEARVRLEKGTDD